MAKRQHGLWLYLDILPDPSQVGCSPCSPEAPCYLHPRVKNRLNNTEMAMVFLKHFNATRQSLFGIGKVYVPRASKLKDLFPVINERMKWESGTRLKLYEVTNGVFSQRGVLIPHPGNQPWHDRAHEAGIHFRPE